MADTTSLVATEKFEKGKDMASEMQVWYRALNVNSLTSLTAVEEGSFLLGSLRYIRQLR